MSAPARCVVTGDVLTGDGRTLRVAHMVEASGEETLILAVGTGQGPSWREDPSEGLVVPVATVAGLLEALGRVRSEAG
ncbi:MAG: hypothetical protein Q8N53_09885 [Longimicrobiales bacterium]|nr:hypothetical protein [Longimicrobiales bacterium]